MSYKRFKQFFYLSFVSFVLSGLSLIFVPITNINGHGIERLLTYIVAIVFWLGIIFGFVFLIKTSSERRGIERRNRKNNNKYHAKQTKQRIGILCFFKNRKAIVSDFLLFFFAILVGGLAFFKIAIEWLVIISIVLLILSFYFHCFLNGKNYRCIMACKMSCREEKEYE